MNPYKEELINDLLKKDKEVFTSRIIDVLIAEILTNENLFKKNPKLVLELLSLKLAFEIS